MDHGENGKNSGKTQNLFSSWTLVRGFSTLKREPFFDILYWNCRNYKIDPERVIFISANMRDGENIKIYNTQNNIDRSIKVVTFNNFESMLFGLNENTIPANEEPQTIAHRHYEETN